MVLSSKYEMVRKLAREFADTEFTKEVLDEAEETGQLSFEVLDKMAKAGFFGIKIPKEYGGQGGDCMEYAIVMEELCQTSTVSGVFVSLANSLGSAPILVAGTEEQKREYLPRIADGSSRACFGLTEPNAGSDAGSMQTKAAKVGDEYILNGSKCFITQAPISDFGIIFAKTAPYQGTKSVTAFIVDLHLPGVSFGKPEKKMGIEGCPTSDIVFEDVHIPASCRLGAEGKGYGLAMQTLDLGRMGAAAQALGTAEGCLKESISYAKERKQFGKPIGRFQALSFMLADMKTDVEAMRQLVYYSARVKDEGIHDPNAACEAKLFCGEKVNEIAYKAVQIHGGYGYMKDYAVERQYRDARILSIYEGTSQVQQMVISGNILR